MTEQSLGIKPHLFFCERQKYGSIAAPRMTHRTVAEFSPFSKILRLARRSKIPMDWLVEMRWDIYYKLVSFSIKVYRTRPFYVIKIGPYMLHFRRWGWDKR